MLRTATQSLRALRTAQPNPLRRAATAPLRQTFLSPRQYSATAAPAEQQEPAAATEGTQPDAKDAVPADAQLADLSKQLEDQKKLVAEFKVSPRSRG